jgi:hypothetical protein
MSILTTHRDGIYLSPQATLLQLTEESLLQEYADGLIPQAIEHLLQADISLVELLFTTETEYYPLFTTLICLDAEIKTIFKEKIRAFPLPALLTYQQKLATGSISIRELRLPPLNFGGHYSLTVPEDGFCVATRMDIHPTKLVAGHVRISINSPNRPPVRVEEIERRLTWQVLNQAIIEEAILRANTSPPLTDQEQHFLLQSLLLQIP